jgi:hypothetical protein
MVLVPGEDGRQYLELVQALNDQFSPVGCVEAFLVETMATQIWRLQRVPRIEAGILTYQYNLVSDQPVRDNAKVIDVAPIPAGENGGEVAGDDSVESPDDSTEDHVANKALGLAFIRASRDHDAISTLTRYQREIERSFYKANGELARLQAIRRREDSGSLSPKPSPVLAVGPPIAVLPAQAGELPTSTTRLAAAPLKSVAVSTYEPPEREQTPAAAADTRPIAAIADTDASDA